MWKGEEKSNLITFILIETVFSPCEFYTKESTPVEGTVSRDQLTLIFVTNSAWNIHHQ